MLRNERCSRRIVIKINAPESAYAERNPNSVAALGANAFFTGDTFKMMVTIKYPPSASASPTFDAEDVTVEDVIVECLTFTSRYFLFYGLLSLIPQFAKAH